MKQGLLYEVKGKIYPYEELEIRLYGYDNRYCVVARRALGVTGGVSSQGAAEGLFDVQVMGMGLKASEIVRISENNVTELTEDLSTEELRGIAGAKLLEDPAFEARFVPISAKFHRVRPDEIGTILEFAQGLAERPATHVVRGPIMNANFPSRRPKSSPGLTGWMAIETLCSWCTHPPFRP